MTTEWLEPQCTEQRLRILDSLCGLTTGVNPLATSLTTGVRTSSEKPIISSGEVIMAGNFAVK